MVELVTPIRSSAEEGSNSPDYVIGTGGAWPNQGAVAAGALRAMELDIDPQWAAFAYCTSPNSGADLLPNMNYGPGHWLSNSSLDFIAVFTR